ncbi:hypothetical protein I4U23_010406 [Adineta vaga]|nr:hypothetical protein I4U23_010406 [Adineta vaga]
MKFIQRLVTSFNTLHIDFYFSTKLEQSLSSSKLYNIVNYVPSNQMESLSEKRSTVSLISPKTATIDTILSIDDSTNSSLFVEENELPTKNSCLLSKDMKMLSKDDADISFIHWIIENIIYLTYIALFACLIAVFMFTLVFYIFDLDWFQQLVVNNSSQWNIDMDYDLISTTQIMNYDNDGY